MGKFQDLTGQTFGNLKVIGKTTDPIKSKKGKGVYWDCELWNNSTYTVGQRFFGECRYDL